MTTTYERIKFELASRFNLNKYHNDTIVKINGHEKAATFIRIVVQDTYIVFRFVSYRTTVMSVFIPNVHNKECTFNAPYLWIKGLYSATTRKHIGWWVNWLVDMGVVPYNWNYYTIKQAWNDKEEDKPMARLYF